MQAILIILNMTNVQMCSGMLCISYTLFIFTGFIDDFDSLLFLGELLDMPVSMHILGELQAGGMILSLLHIH